MCYGFAPSGFGLGGQDIALIVVAMMVGQASLSGDTFAIYSYDTGGYVVWEGSPLKIIRVAWIICLQTIRQQTQIARLLHKEEQTWEQDCKF